MYYLFLNHWLIWIKGPKSLLYLSSPIFFIGRCCLWHGSPAAPLDDIESTLEINCFFILFYFIFFWDLRAKEAKEREETEFVEKGEEATAARHHTTIVRYHHHHHHHHLSRPPSLVTTTIASQIRLHRSRHHHRHARHNHHWSLLCLSFSLCFFLFLYGLIRS